MVKNRIKRIFALVGAGLAPVAAIFYIILGIKSAIAITDIFGAKEIIFLLLNFLLCFGLAFFLTTFGAKALFGYLNKKDNTEPFAYLVLSFAVFQFIDNLIILCFYGGTAAIWLILIFSLFSAVTLILRLTGIKVARRTVVLGVVGGMITAMTVACAETGLALVAAIILSVICFVIGAIYSLDLIKDEDEKEEKTEE